MLWLLVKLQPERCRRFMAQCPERWDYSAAAIPSALTQDMAAHQEARAADKKARHRAKEKARLGTFTLCRR